MVEEIDHRTDQWALGCIAWEMLLGRGPFVADDAGALFYQIINLNPQPLAPRVPGLPADVEPVLRRALNKQPAARFPSMRDLSRAFEAAAFGRSADATPAPVLVSIPSNATIGYSETRFQGTPAARTPPDLPRLESSVRDPVAQVVRMARKPEPDTLQTTDEPVRVALWNHIKPIHAIVAAAGVLVLLLMTFLLLRSGSAHKLPPASPVPSVVSPLPPSPVPAIAAPESTGANPADGQPEAPRGKRPKRLDGVTSTKKPNPFGDSFESSPRPKPKSKAKKNLYEDL
jgi:serine/threonine-protein kinase